jgi:CRISPR system Cascade subunit CasA
MLNLLRDRCFPIERANGQRDRIALYEITQDHQDDQKRVVRFRLPRPDLEVATYSFAIAILQTTLMPKERPNWRKLLANIPDPSTLQAAFESHADAFNLFGPETRFMQDKDLADAGETRSIDGLLIDTPGGNTLKNNADFFQKRGQVKGMTPFYAAMSLFCLQSMAPSGGVGHRTSLRGGGPIQTLLISSDEKTPLWNNLWMNVVTKNKLREYDNPNDGPDNLPLECYPWLSATQISDVKKGNPIFPEMRHPLQVLWAMPRRIRLQQPAQGGTCDISGETTDTLITHYSTKNYGNNYDSKNWNHPLSPHYVADKDNNKLPLLGKPNMNSYQHWLAFTLGVPNHKDKNTDLRSPATVVFLAHRTRQKDLRPLKPRIWVTGYDMDNAKAREWIDFMVPIILPQEENSNRVIEFRDKVMSLIDITKENAGTLTKAVKTLVSRNPNQKGDFSFIEKEYWFATEATFYDTIGQLANQLTKEQEEALLEKWLTHLNAEARLIFDSLLEQRELDKVDLMKVYSARSKVLYVTGNSNPKHRKNLNLPEKPKKKKRKDEPNARD